MFKEITAAALSFKPEKFAVENNAGRLEQAFHDAADGGAELAVAPEGILEGYVVNEIISGEVPAGRMNDVALSLRSPVIGRFRSLARDRKICLAFGLAEKIKGDVYNCAIFIDQTGRIRGKYHKMQLAEGYHHTWWFNRLGKNSRAFDTPFGKCGFLICNDRWNDDIARIPILDGARFLLIPSFGDRSKAQDKAVLCRARENGVPIVEANVGVTLIISKGEVVSVSRKTDGMVFGDIAIPVEPTERNRDQHERNFLKWRKQEMPKRYNGRVKHVNAANKAGKPTRNTKVRHDSKGRLVAEMVR